MTIIKDSILQAYPSKSTHSENTGMPMFPFLEPRSNPLSYTKLYIRPLFTFQPNQN